VPILTPPFLPHVPRRRFPGRSVQDARDIRLPELFVFFAIFPLGGRSLSQCRPVQRAALSGVVEGDHAATSPSVVFKRG